MIWFLQKFICVVTRFIRYHIWTLIFCRNLVTHHHSSVEYHSRCHFCHPLPHQDIVHSGCPCVSLRHLRSLIIRAVTCHISPHQGVDLSCYHFGFHRSPHLDIDHSCCHFSHIPPHQAIIVRTVTFVARHHKIWVSRAAICLSSISGRGSFALLLCRHYHIRTDLIRLSL